MSRSGQPFDESRFRASAGPRLIATLQDISRQIRLLQAQQLDAIAELERQGIAALAGYPSTRALVIEALRVAPGQATKLVSRSAASPNRLPRPGMSGRRHCRVCA